MRKERLTRSEGSAPLSPAATPFKAPEGAGPRAALLDGKITTRRTLRTQTNARQETSSVPVCSEEKENLPVSYKNSSTKSTTEDELLYTKKMLHDKIRRAVQNERKKRWWEVRRSRWIGHNRNVPSPSAPPTRRGETIQLQLAPPPPPSLQPGGTIQLQLAPPPPLPIAPVVQFGAPAPPQSAPVMQVPAYPQSYPYPYYWNYSTR